MARITLAERVSTAPDPAALAHVDAWVFDLDNTLYPVACGPYPQVDRRIRDFIARALGTDEVEAYCRQKHYLHTYGTSLRGMTHEHGTDPQEFLRYVHDVDLSCIPTDPNLDAALGQLPGRKVIFTNADVPYAERVLDRIGIRRHFEMIFDIVAADYLPKPHRASYERMLAAADIEPRRSAMIEDLPRNLEPAAELGMTTVWVKNDGEWVISDERRDTLKRQYAETGARAHHVVEHLESWICAVAVR
ncbi:MAG: pyrimidine 5'-nucleotidase [Alphaproteobacteria bacterium]|nr:pyrimidine 5'-nucleotidase [Alphaproteobacteria bacterium]